MNPSVPEQSMDPSTLYNLVSQSVYFTIVSAMISMYFHVTAASHKSASGISEYNQM
jgi:hypothetical protein